MCWNRYLLCVQYTESGAFFNIGDGAGRTRKRQNERRGGIQTGFVRVYMQRAEGLAN